jgi:hypothetical protein
LMGHPSVAIFVRKTNFEVNLTKLLFLEKN